jgi:hypothetical protein
MDDKRAKSGSEAAPNEPHKKESNEQVNFDKAQGSSRNDEADLRDVARKAAKKFQSQIRQAESVPRN